MKRIVVCLVMLSLLATLFLGCASPEVQSPTSEQAPASELVTASPTQPAASPSISPAPVETPESDTQTLGTGFGAIEVRVTDAPKYGIEKVEVFFSEVQVHKAAEDPDGEGEWISLTVEDGYFDLVELGKEGIEELMAGDEYVPAGKYTQLRVVIDKPVLVTYTETAEATEETEAAETTEAAEEEEPTEFTVEAKLPSGELKFVHPFEVVDSTTTIITLDFIVEDSVIFTGKTQQNPDTQADEPKVIVKPVVKLSVEQESLTGTIAGTVTDSETDEPIVGATVTVDGTGLSAETGEDGSYEITGIPVGADTATYDVIATADGYEEATEEDVEVSADTTTTVDFALEPEVES